MIVVSVILVSAITGKATELARMEIANVGGTRESGDYEGKTYIGRSSEALERRVISHHGRVEKYPRLRIHVWNLVARMLRAMNYE